MNSYNTVLKSNFNKLLLNLSPIVSLLVQPRDLQGTHLTLRTLILIVKKFFMYKKKKKINTHLKRVMTSNFAFGGINATQVLKNWVENSC